MKIQRTIAIIIACLLPTLGFAGACVDNLDQYVENQTLDLSSCKFDAGNIPAIAAYLTVNPTVTGLSIADHFDFKLTPANVAPLTQVKTLKSLNLNGTFVDSAFVNYVIQNTNLTSLSLYWTVVDDDIIPALINNTSIEQLDLSNTGVDAKGLLDLAKNKHLQYLNIRNLPISNDAISALADNPLLTTFKFGHDDTYINNPVDEASLIRVAQNQHLTHLEMLYQIVTPRVLEVLAQNQHLAYLLLYHDSINDRGARNFAAMGGLQYLNLEGNPIGDDGVIAISSNHSITRLSLRRTNINEVGIYALADNTHLKQLNLSRNSGLSINSLRALVNNTTLTSLDLSDTGIYDDLAEILSHDATLQCLNVAYNHIGNVGALAIANNMVIDTLLITQDEFDQAARNAIKANPNIKHLNINGYLGPYSCFTRDDNNG